MNDPMTGDFPHYSYPGGMVAGLAFDFLFRRAHSFREDGLACMGRLKPGLQVQGAKAVPQNGPCLVTFNHYYRSGFNAWWMALALAATIPAEVHFVMTGELTFPGKWYAPVGRAGSRWLLKRFSTIYGFTSMPPMPPRPQDVKARALSVRRVLEFARSHPLALLGLAPEGGDQPGGLLNLPPAGAGRFILLLAAQGFPILPVGCFEEAGAFCLRFGEAYRLEVARDLSPDEKDRQAAQIVMSAIAMQLPAQLRGKFG
jgi:Acyltransferase